MTKENPKLSKRYKAMRNPFRIRLFGFCNLIFILLTLAAGYYLGYKNTRSDICGDLIYYHTDEMEFIKLRGCDI